MFKKILPILQWLPSYKKDYFSGDLTAGLTVGIMLIPQGMAYAMIAGLPPVFGLYAALMPQIIYAIMGTSRQLAVGPVAMDSLPQDWVQCLCLAWIPILPWPCF